MSLIVIPLVIVFVFCITMVVGGVAIMIAIRIFQGLIYLLWGAVIATDWCWRKKQPLIGSLLLFMIVFVISFILFITHLIPVDYAGNSIIAGILIVFLALPVQIWMWIRQFMDWKRGPEPVIGRNPIQAEFIREVTLVQNAEGVYVPNG